MPPEETPESVYGDPPSREDTEVWQAWRTRVWADVFEALGATLTGLAAEMRAGTLTYADDVALGAILGSVVAGVENGRQFYQREAWLSGVENARNITARFVSASAGEELTAAVEHFLNEHLGGGSEPL